MIAVRRTVLTKVGKINHEFRFFDVEVLAGEDNLITELRENGLRFKLDFGKV